MPSLKEVLETIIPKAELKKIWGFGKCGSVLHTMKKRDGGKLIAQVETPRYYKIWFEFLSVVGRATCSHQQCNKGVGM